MILSQSSFIILRTFSQQNTVTMCDINQHVTCKLCAGYLIDATTITECLHTCKSVCYGICMLVTTRFYTFQCNITQKLIRRGSVFIVYDFMGVFKLIVMYILVHVDKPNLSRAQSGCEIVALVARRMGYK